MFKKTISIPGIKSLENTYRSLTSLEKLIFYVLSFVLVTSTFALAHKVYVSSTVLVPHSGGSISEGVVGAPRFVNPVLAISQTDKDLTELIYAGLMTTDTDGKLVPELAKSYSVSADATEYTFILRENLAFHDGTPLSSDDVIFTIQKAVDPAIKSPERSNWDGVTVTKVDEKTIRFKLNKPYVQFMQNMLLGILPQEHWGKLTADEFIFSKLNTAPIGSGPYQFTSAEHNASGIPSSFKLSKFKKYVLGKPYIKELSMHFYSDGGEMVTALKHKEISSISEISSMMASDLAQDSSYKVELSTLPRIFAVFFNQSHNASLKDIRVRKALRDSINTNELIEQVLSGFAKPIHSPLLTGSTSAKQSKKTLTTQEAQAMLAKAGWVLDAKQGKVLHNGKQLTVTLTTANTDELKSIAKYISAQWARIGVAVKLEVFEPGNLAQSVLRTREYDALLFGEIVGTNPDPYAFWHSSQRSDPGLNIANYTNQTVDALLLKARKTLANDARAGVYAKLANIISNDAPAIFLYAPEFIYITNTNVHGINFAPVIEPHERFANVHLWHIDTGRRWSFLTD